MNDWRIELEPTRWFGKPPAYRVTRGGELPNLLSVC